MALINCKECNTQVSDTALKCNQCGFQLRKPKRSIIGKIFKWSFILFNLLMVYWLVSAWINMSHHLVEVGSSAEQAGRAIGATLGTSIILGIWGFGDVVLGLFVLFTRPKS